MRVFVTGGTGILHHRRPHRPSPACSTFWTTVITSPPADGFTMGAHSLGRATIVATAETPNDAN